MDDLTERILRLRAALQASETPDDLGERLERLWTLLHGHKQASVASELAKARKGQGGGARWWCTGCSGFSSGPETVCPKCRHMGAVFSENAPTAGGADRRARLRAGQAKRNRLRR